MKLTYTTDASGEPVTLTRFETDPGAISTLKRKGWVEVSEDPIDPPAEIVPQEVPFWAFRSVLDLSGLTPQVAEILAAIPGEAGVIARNQWEYATVAERTNATITALASQLGLTPEQVDGYFIQAGSIATSTQP